MRFQVGSVLCALLLAVSAAGESDQCDIQAAIKQGREQLVAITPKVQGKAVYRSVVHMPDGKEAILPKLQTGYSSREVPLARLDRYTCAVDVILPRHEVRDGRLTEPLGVPGLHLEKQFGAVEWNWSNTAFTFDDPRYVVIGEWWKPYGKEPVFTVPYSVRLHLAYPEVALRGEKRLDKNLVQPALEFLGDLGYVPRDTFARRSRRIKFYFRVEHIDQEEFLLASDAARRLLIDKAFVQLELNEGNAFSKRKSSAGAVGAVQIEPKTCKDFRANFSKAHFASDCNGAMFMSPQMANVAVGILVDQDKERQLFEAFGEEVYAAPWGDLLSGASYNAGTVRPRKAVQYTRQWGGEWDQVRLDKNGNLRPDSLRRETAIYVAKIKYVMQVEGERIATAFLAGGAPR